MGLPTSYATLYEGSVKDLKGPITVGSDSCLVFDYTDAYSVFDWGRMPDLLPNKGEALATLAGCWLEKLEKSETWQAFSKSSVALQLRKANRFGSAFIEAGEALQQTGLRTHYRGMLSSGEKPKSVSQLTVASQQFAVLQVSAVRPKSEIILGRTVPNYLSTRSSPAPRLIPLEVVFRFSCPEGSSLIDRASRDSTYMASIGFGEYQAVGGQKWGFPVLEIFTKLESSDRPLTLSEGLAISGLTG
ncbi:MAG: phosphoribosylaminoimidazolesuccinocarboxamide synthase, partial [Bdellovibrionota bacterium]